MSWLLANAIAASVLALLVLAIERWLRPTPAVLHGLWLLVMLKLVTPPLFTVPVDLEWSQPSPAMVVGVPADEDASVRVVSAAAPRAWAPDRQESPPRARDPLPFELADSDVVSVHLPEPSPTAAPTNGVVSMLLWAWAATAVLLLSLTFGRGLRAAAGLRRRQQPAPAWLEREVAELAQQIGVRAPRLLVDPGNDSPYVWSFGRTRLVLPSEALRHCDARARRAVLAHELAHVARGDHWIARAEVLLQATLWWHPLFWFARSRMCLWAEIACDAVAVRTVPDSSHAYATVLVDAVATPAPTGPAVAALSWRPARRAAFERRLKMILNDSLLRRASRAWCIPFAAISLGLFAQPATAQEPERDVRIEIRVNGKPVEGLSDKQRKSLLKLLGDRKAKAEVDVSAKRDDLGSRAKKLRERRRKVRSEWSDNWTTGTAGKASELRSALREGLAEARRELANDEDLRELGITDEVTRLLDDLAEGNGIENSIDDVVRAAMRGASGLVEREIANDPDLKKLGIGKGITELVQGFLGDSGTQRMVGQLARKALRMGLAEAKQDLRNDPELKELGIAGDIEGMLDGLLQGDGKSLDTRINTIVDKAMKAAGQSAHGAQGKVRVNTSKSGRGRAKGHAREARGQHRSELQKLERELDRARRELERARRELERVERRASGSGSGSGSGR